MKAAPNYIPGEAVDGKWKAELLIWLGRIFNFRKFFETGTCDGGTLEKVFRHFDECHSIELSEHYYQIAQEKFKYIYKVGIHFGNSATKLWELLENFNRDEPLLFWLDAHSSGGLTANEGDPLPEEIKAIMELSPNSLVVIDDEPNDLRVKELINDEWTTEYRTGITFLYKKGMYQIPEFE